MVSMDQLDFSTIFGYKFAPVPTSLSRYQICKININKILYQQNLGGSFHVCIER